MIDGWARRLRRLRPHRRHDATSISNPSFPTRAMLPHRAHRSVTSLQLARPCGLAARFYATPAARKATLFPAKPTAPPPAAPAEPAFKPKTAAGGRIVEQPRAPALVKLQERMLSFHTVRALLQLGGDFAGWMSLAAGSAGPNGAKVDRMEAMLMMR